jgi:ABC-2 type transport system ATP-binding protein
LLDTFANRTLAVEVEKVSFSFGSVRALDDLTLSVPKGVSFGLLGPNGSGKTTLIRILVGLLKPRRGKVSVLGQPPSPKVASQIGYMPQLSALYGELSIVGNVNFFARIYGLKNVRQRAELVDETIKLVELSERKQASINELSGGMRQRVSLACALVHRPSLLLLDEPTVGLDPELRVNFWNHFRNLTAQGITLVISSHTMDDAAHCEHLAFLREGRVIAQGTPAQLTEATGNPKASLEDAFLYFTKQETPRNVA